MAKIGARHGLDTLGERREVRVDPSFNLRHGHFLGFREGAQPCLSHRCPFLFLLLCCCICVTGVRHVCFVCCAPRVEGLAVFRVKGAVSKCEISKSSHKKCDSKFIFVEYSFYLRVILNLSIIYQQNFISFKKNYYYFMNLFIFLQYLYLFIYSLFTVYN